MSLSPMNDALASIPQVVVQSLAIYLFLILALTFLGRRALAQLTLMEYVIIALLGSAVETGLYAGSSSVVAGITSATTLLVANRLMDAIMTRSTWLRRRLIGQPMILVHNGQIVRPNLRRAQLTESNLMAAVRLRGYDNLEAVRFAVLEPNGEIGVVPVEKPEKG